MPRSKSSAPIVVEGVLVFEDVPEDGEDSGSSQGRVAFSACLALGAEPDWSGTERRETDTSCRRPCLFVLRARLCIERGPWPR